MYPKEIIYEMYSDDVIADRPLLELSQKSYIVKKNNIILYDNNVNINKRKKLLNLNKQIINYLIIGVLTTLVNIITKYALLFTIFDAKDLKQLQLVVIISWVVAVLFAYVTNRKIVFKSKNSSVLKEFVKFIEARILTLIVEMLFMYIFVTLLKLDTDLLVAILSVISQFIVIVLNYIFSKIFIFKTK